LSIIKDSNKIKINILHYKEIIVVDGFEVENGVLGLDRDIYLSIVKFLDSSIVRKVRVNILFFYFANSFWN
jgi:hypothetical protein